MIPFDFPGLAASALTAAALGDRQQVFGRSLPPSPDGGVTWKELVGELIFQPATGKDPSGALVI